MAFDPSSTEKTDPQSASQTAPQIDYLAKDFHSFRRLMQDRLALLAPQLVERNPADLSAVLLDALAWAADSLSYYQDAVATEAYIGTARQRISMRRHARLLDYHMHDGGNARVFVALFVAASSSADGAGLPLGTQFVTQLDHVEVRIPSEQLTHALSQDAQIFESLHAVTLHAARNEIAFHIASDATLPIGATRATLRIDARYLRTGDVVILEERVGKSGQAFDADPSHRHAVRLTHVAARTVHVDGAPDVAVLDVVWAAEDALPFALSLSAAVVLGNVVLADHGLTLPEEVLPPIVPSERYRPTLLQGPLTQQGQVLCADGYHRPFDPSQPARAAFQFAMRDVKPAILLQETTPGGPQWSVQRDLLGSAPAALDFVVEIDDEGRAHLRFGDDTLGRKPDRALISHYRIGNGQSGNIGAEALAHVVGGPAGITRLRNPLQAQGGVDPESIEQVRIHAPRAFRTQERAISADDYASLARRHPQVQDVLVSRRFTGSWHTFVVVVQRALGQPVDAAFAAELRAFLDPYRLAGHELRIIAPRYVPLDIKLTVQVGPGYFRSAVQAALLAALGSATQKSGRRGFFHAGNWSFGQPLYFSQLVRAAMQVSGVRSIDTRRDSNITRFQRADQSTQNTLAQGVITVEPQEILRLLTDSQAPDSGRLELSLQGGQ